MRVSVRLGRAIVVGVCASFLVGFAGAGTAQAALKRLKASSHDGAVKVLVGKKSSLYYRASQAKPAEFMVDGALPLRVLARSLVLETGKPVRHLVIEVDGKVIRTLSLKASASKDAVVEGAGKAGRLTKGVVRLAAGKHKIRIYPREENHVAAVRVFSGSARAQALKWVPFAPDSYEKAARLQIKDAETTCYRFTSATPIGLTLLGPIRLKLATRLDFGEANGYTQAYVVKALLDGKPWKSFSLRSRASQTATYPDMNELVPGVPQAFQLDVPHGSHQVTLILDGTTATGATLQIRVPTKDLKPRSPHSRS